MKVRNLFLAILAAAAMLVGCKEKEEPAGAPSIKVTLDETALPVPATGGEVKVSILANRDWKVGTLPTGVESVTPSEGPASAEVQEVVVKLGKNEGRKRKITITFGNDFVSEIVKIDQTGENDVPLTAISTIREKAKDYVFEEGTVIGGVVVSDGKLNNFTSSKALVIQDETAGIYLFLSANHEIARGSQVEVDLSGAKMGEFESLLQIEVANDKVSVVEENVELNAKKVSMDDLLAHKYESQYIEIEAPVQVSNSDLSKKFVEGGKTTNIKMEDEDGNVFYVRSGQYSSFKDETVPQGSGIIKGIASRYKNDLQLYFSAKTDYAALTGARFTKESVSGDIKTVLEAGLDTPVSTEGVVMGIYEAGCVISDESGTALIANENVSQSKETAAPNVKIGDKVTVSGTIGKYGDLKQIIVPADYNTIKVTSSNNTVTYPEPTAITKDNIASVDRVNCNYITFDGTLSVSDNPKGGKYYNVAIDGTTVQGSLSYVLESQNIEALAGKRATYTGYFCGGNNSNYVNMLVVNAAESTKPYISVDPASLKFAAAGETKTFTVSSNVEWTATSSDQTNFPVIVTENTVSITVAANTGAERSATVTVQAKDNASLKETVSLVQSAPIAAGAKYVKVTTDQTDWSGQYLIVFENDASKAYVFAGVDATTGSYKQADIVSNEIAWTNELSEIEVDIATMDGGYSIKFHNSTLTNPYISGSTTKEENKVIFSSSPVANAINGFKTNQSSTGVEIMTNNLNILVFNNTTGQLRWRFYKKTTVAGQSNYMYPQLYKLVK